MQIIILLTAIAVLAYFSAAARNYITTAFTTAGYLVQGAWARRPTTGQVLRIILIPILMMIVPWVIFFIIMTWLGTMFNAPWAGALIGILFPMWSLMFLVRRIPFFSRIVAIPYWITTLILVLVVPLFLVGFWSPDVKGSLNERSDDSKVWTANFLKKGSAHSERNAGVRAKVKSATRVYDDFNKPIEGIISAGRIVMVLKNIQSKPATENREALLSVMLPDQHGNFVDGKKVWMPALKIEFVNNEEQDKDSATSATFGEKRSLCWQKPEGYVGLTQTKSRCDAVTVKFLEQGFRLEITASLFSVTGERIGENSYQGRYKNASGEEGDIFLKFSPDFKLATGWQKDPGKQVEIYTWLQ